MVTGIQRTRSQIGVPQRRGFLLIGDFKFLHHDHVRYLETRGPYRTCFSFEAPHLPSRLLRGVGSVLVWVSAYLFPLCLLIKYFLLEPGDLRVIFIISSLYSVSLLNCWMESRENQLVIFPLILCFNCASRKDGRGGHSLSVSSN